MITEDRARPSPGLSSPYTTLPEPCDLNPTERVWSHVKHSLGNLAVTNADHLAAIVRNRLRRIRYRPELLDSFLAHTGLTLEPEPP